MLALAAVTRVCRVLPILQLYSMQHLILDSMSCFVACQLHQRGEGFLAKLGGLRRTATAPQWTDAGFQNRDSLFSRRKAVLSAFSRILYGRQRRQRRHCQGRSEGREGSARWPAAAAASAAVLVLRVFVRIAMSVSARPSVWRARCSLVIYDEQISLLPAILSLSLVAVVLVPPKTIDPSIESMATWTRRLNVLRVNCRAPSGCSCCACSWTLPNRDSYLVTSRSLVMSGSRVKIDEKYILNL